MCNQYLLSDLYLQSTGSMLRVAVRARARGVGSDPGRSAPGRPSTPGASRDPWPLT